MFRMALLCGWFCIVIFQKFQKVEEVLQKVEAFFHFVKSNKPKAGRPVAAKSVEMGKKKGRRAARLRPVDPAGQGGTDLLPDRATYEATTRCCCAMRRTA